MAENENQEEQNAENQETQESNISVTVVEADAPTNWFAPKDEESQEEVRYMTLEVTTKGTTL
jgi:hypothetical protein